MMRTSIKELILMMTILLFRVTFLYDLAYAQSHEKKQSLCNAVVPAEVVERLGAGPGVITLQLFLTVGDRIQFIEINPRFGGGAPLSIKAGANFPQWILRELLGKKESIRFNRFKDGLIMLRYDGEVWFDGSKNRI